MSDVLSWETEQAAPARRPRRWLYVVAAVVAVIALGAAALVALDLRGTTSEQQGAAASHRALVAAASVWDPLWQQLPDPPKARDLEAITGAASVGVPTPGGTAVSTEVVVDDPNVLGVIITVQSEGITTYITQVVRQNPYAAGADDSQSFSCDAGEMVEGQACLDVIQAQAHQWSTSR